MIGKGLTGKEKYLVAAIVFGLTGVSLFIRHILVKSPFAIFSFGFIPASVFMFHFWSLAKKGETVPERNSVLFISYLFSWVGLSFLVFGILANELIAAIIGGLDFVLATPLFVMEGIKLIKTIKAKPVDKIGHTIKTYTKIITILFTLAGLSPVLLMVFFMFSKGEIVVPLIILGLLAGAVWLFFKIKNKP